MSTLRQLLYVILITTLATTQPSLSQSSQPDVSLAQNPVLQFLKNNPDRSSAYVIRNDTVLVDLRSARMFPLASTVKIIVAIAFAEQIAAGKINPNELVSFADLDLYYLPNTDGGAHPRWKQDATTRNALTNNQVTLLEVAKGMIRHSSNANTEYLMDRLGVDNINATLTNLKLAQHGRLYPIVSAQMVCSPVGTDKGTLTNKLTAMSMSDYEKACFAVHEQLKNDRDGSFKKTFIFPDLDLQKIWSDRLTASTTRDYAQLLSWINKRNYFTPAVQNYLDQIMQWPFEVNAKNKDFYVYLGAKGGSTAFVFTNALYATTKAGDHTEVVVFFNNLTVQENMSLQQQFNTFMLSCLSPMQSKVVAEKLK